MGRVVACLNSLLCAQFCSNCPSGSGEEILQTGGRTAGDKIHVFRSFGPLAQVSEILLLLKSHSIV